MFYVKTWFLASVLVVGAVLSAKADPTLKTLESSMQNYLGVLRETQAVALPFRQNDWVSPILDLQIVSLEIYLEAANENASDFSIADLKEDLEIFLQTFVAFRESAVEPAERVDPLIDATKALLTEIDPSFPYFEESLIQSPVR